MKSRSLFCAALAVLLLLLSACGHPAPEASGAAAEGLSATVKAEHLDAYGEEPGPVLYAERIEPAEPAKEEVIQF